jgi:hypothetical protein
MDRCVPFLRFFGFVRPELRNIGLKNRAGFPPCQPSENVFRERFHDAVLLLTIASRDNGLLRG